MSNMGVKPVVELKQLTRSFEQGGERIDVLRGVDLAIRPGEIVALLGPSGSGKSTLLQAVSLLEGGFGGEIVIGGHSAEKSNSRARTVLRRDHLGFVYQFHHLLPEFTALENVMMPCALGGMAVSRSRDKAASLLQRVGLAERLDHKPGELSGGERQRVAIARALVNEPDCVLMDEPTGNLDEHTGEGVQALIESLRDQLGIAFVMVTHDMKMARSLGRVMRLEQGRLIQEA